MRERGFKINKSKISILFLLLSFIVLSSSLSQAFEAQSASGLNVRLQEQLQNIVMEVPLIAKVMPGWGDVRSAGQEQQALAYQELLVAAIASAELNVKQSMLRHSYWRDINVLRMRALVGEDFAVERIVLRTEAEMLEVIDLLRLAKD